jgi:hypothetical protein
MILLMSPTANTVLSFIIGFVCGALAIAFWYGREAIKEESNFDEADIYHNKPLKRVK